VKANVIFFTKGRPTEHVWVYDGRTNVPSITKKERPLMAEHFAEFERCYGAEPNGRSDRTESDASSDRWRSFGIDEVKARDFKLDGFKWLREESLDALEEVDDPEELVTDAVLELQEALEELNRVLTLLDVEVDAVIPSDGVDDRAA
jgi:type I restriction enzyme M protein